MSLALWFSGFAALCHLTLVVLVARRGLRLRVHQFFFLYLVTMLIWQVGYIAVSLSHSASMALTWYRIVIIAGAAQGFLLLFFARALLRLHHSPWHTLVAFLVWGATVLALALDRGGFILDIRRDPVSHLYVPHLQLPTMLVAAPSMGFLLGGLYTLVQGYRRALSDLEHNRLRYLVLATGISILGGLANLVPLLRGFPVDVAANIICALLLSYAILRYQLLDITFVVRRGLAYSVLTVGIAATYLLSVILFERLVQAMITPAAYLVPIGLAMIAAVLLRPWRERAQAWVDRLLFREQYDSRRMVQELSRQTAAILDLEVLVDMLLSRLCTTMRLAGAALFLKEAGSQDYCVAARRGVDEAVVSMRLGRDHPIVQWLQRSERPLRAQDLDMQPQFRSLWGREREGLKQLGAELFIPLLVKDALVGILAVGPKETGESFSQDDNLTLSTLANQTAVAVENARLMSVTRARVAELTALQEIGVRLVSTRDLPKALTIVAESGLELLAADEADVVLYDAENGRLTESRSLVRDRGEHVLPEASAVRTLVEMAVHSGQPVVTSDVRLHAAVPPSLARASEAQAAAVQPLKRDGRVIGALAVAHHRPHTFSVEELRLLAMLSDQATLAIENAQLLASEQAKRQLADTLREVSRVIGSTLQLDLLLELVLEQLQNVVNYDDAAIMLLRGDQLEITNARGSPRTVAMVGSTIPLASNSLLRELVREREPMLSPDIQAESRWTPTEREGLLLRAFIGVPLVVRDQPRGVLLVGRAEPDCYSSDDLQNVVAFANQTAIAIENALLYQETIAEKRKTEIILRESLSGIVVTDTDLRIVTFNSGAEAITGYPADEVIGKRLADVLGPDVVSERSPLGRAIATGERVPPQETVIRAANGLRDILQGAVALHDASQRLFGYLLSFSDITRLKEVDRLKTDIVANVSHELRTPLASIKAYTELLLDNIEGDDKAMRDQLLHIIDQETDRLSQLIGDLLDLSRLEAGRFEVRKTALRIGDLLAEVLRALEVQRQSRNVAIRTEVPADLPELLADREMVSIIIKNLLTNAIKFSHRGGEVIARVLPSPDYLLFQVTDHGVGIPEEAMPQLFQKFFRVRSTSESGVEGTGLGLVLVKQAVEAHGGTVEVRSKVGVGSTFTVRLPWGRNSENGEVSSGVSGNQVADHR
ncbi:MAG: GAF domain-containing protein [Anaerolineae bacterium]|nr:GAF domain-containing protein [Anaerolineae bacterium]